MRTILDLLRWASSKFNNAEIHYGHGTNNFWDEALHLILTSLYLPINIPTCMYYSSLTKKERTLIIKLINRRVYERIPVPYLTNKAWFFGLEFYVDKRVFIPRSPIGELIMSNFQNILPKTPNYILDLCTGSGCIAIAIAKVYPNATIDAADISTEALEVAQYNIELHNLSDRIVLIHSNLFDNVPKLKYDLIITNPPYVNHLDIYTLPKEFHHEPILSLSAKRNGLEIIHKIFIKIINYLNINGILICEVGEITKIALTEYYPNTPFHWFTFNNGGTGVFSITYDQLSYLNKKYKSNN